jgi:hypothetical protein
VERAVDGDNVALGNELLKGVYTAGTKSLLELRRQRLPNCQLGFYTSARNTNLVIVVQELLALKSLKTSQDTLSNSANTDSSDNLVLKVILVLGDSGNIPFTGLDLLVCRNKVADKSEDGHDNVLSNGDNVRSSNLSDGDTAVGLVGNIEVDVVRPDTGGYGKLEVLGLSKTVGGQVSRMETTKDISSYSPQT